MQRPPRDSSGDGVDTSCARSPSARRRRRHAPSRQTGRIDWSGWSLRAVILLILAATFAWYFRGDLMVDFARVWATCFNL